MEEWDVGLMDGLLMRYPDLSVSIKGWQSDIADLLTGGGGDPQR